LRTPLRPQAAGVTDAVAAPPQALQQLPAPVVAALLVQNALGARNSGRRRYISEGRHVDPFVAPAAVLRRAYLQVSWVAGGLAAAAAAVGAVCSCRPFIEESSRRPSSHRGSQGGQAVSHDCRALPQVMMQTVQAEVARLKSGRYSALGRDMAGRFAAAASEQEAVEAIRGWHVGRELPLLLEAIRQPGALLPDVKMGALMAGRLRGDKARAAQQESEGHQREGRASWAPSRKNVCRFLRGCRGAVGLERALQLFGGVVGEEYLRVQYAWGFGAQRSSSGRGPVAAPMEVG
jgi:hypothetical protein